MKALVTGGLGFIGHHLAERLLAAGFEVHVLDNGQRGRVDADADRLATHPRYRLIMGDLAGDTLLDSLDRDYTHVFHLAAIVGVRHVVQQPYRVLKENVDLLVRMLSWAGTQRSLERFVFPSTSEVYAGTLESFGMAVPTPEDTPLTITDPAAPRTAYMLSKIYGEALCRHAGVPFTIIRPHNVYGPRMGLAHVIPELLARAHQAADGGRLLVFSPEHRRSFCYIDDATELILRIARSPAGLNATFNLGADIEETRIADLAGLVVETVGKSLTREYGQETDGSPSRRLPDIRRLVAATSYRPRVTLADGVRRTYDWYRANIFDTEGTGYDVDTQPPSAPRPPCPT
jgi:nucleoside-diphosphate-sugar epimerase